MSLHNRVGYDADKAQTIPDGLLNRSLFARMEAAFGKGRVIVSHHSEPLSGEYVKDHVRGVDVFKIIDRGETYSTDCPYCRDTRGRLSINHMFGCRDARTGFYFSELWKCYNEECQSVYENRKDLLDKLFNDGMNQYDSKSPNSLSVDLSGTFKVLTEYQFPGTHIPINSLGADHPASVYLTERQFDLDELYDVWGVTYATDVAPMTKEFRSKNRIIIPVKVNELVVGWQARYVGDLNWKTTGVSKYLTYFPKSLAVYGIGLTEFKDNDGQVIRSPEVVVVEGPTDAWRYGPGAVSILGKSASPTQIRILAEHAHGRPLVFVPDRNDPDSPVLFAKMEDKVVKFQNANKLLVSPTSAVTVPEGLDPGKLDRHTFHNLVAVAVANPNRVAAEQNGDQFSCSTEQL